MVVSTGDWFWPLVLKASYTVSRHSAFIIFARSLLQATAKALGIPTARWDSPPSHFAWPLLKRWIEALDRVLNVWDLGLVPTSLPRAALVGSELGTPVNY